jgi:hypothetical protein
MSFNNARIIGYCPVCHSIVRLSFRDKFQTVGYCTGCGLEYGNTLSERWGTRRKVITEVELRRLVNEAYGELSKIEKRLKIQTFVQTLNLASTRMTGYGIPDIPVRTLNRWGYDVVAGYIVKRETSEE